MIINILSPNTVGGTFLDWSLHYLAGHNTVYSGIGTDNIKQRKLVNDPIDTFNAHGYVKNHPCGLQETVSAMRRLRSINTPEFHTLYSFFLPISNQTLIEEYEHDTDCKLLWNVLCNDDIIPIWLSLPNDSKSQLFLNTTAKRVLPIMRYKNRNVPYTQHFKNDQLIWDNTGLTNKWDKREFLALNKRPFSGIKYNLDFTKPHIYINPLDLMTSFDNNVDELFSKLKLSIIPTRRSEWIDIYSKWKKIHLPRIQWVSHFDEIMNAVLNGYTMDISSFNLDIMQEATIQHVLIYKYGLNLKTWELDVFPNNTKHIHELIEENIHPITPYKIPI